MIMLAREMANALRLEFLTYLHNRSRLFKFAVLVILDWVFLTAAVLIAYMLRMSEFALPQDDAMMLALLGPICSIVSAAFFRVYWSITRVRSQGIGTRIVVSQIPAAIVWALLALALGTYGFPRSIVIIYAVMASMVMIGYRRLIALFMGDKATFVRTRNGTPTVILGADSIALDLFTSLKRGNEHELIAFVDTDESLVGGFLAGRKVLPLEIVPELIETQGVREVLVAKRNFSRAQFRELVEFLQPYHVSIKVIPGLDDVAGGRVEVRAARAVRVEDLLGRDPVNPRDELMKKAIAGKNVLVTGAGGSIGSEIVRQIRKYDPSSLILIDNNEFALFEIHREIEAAMKGADFLLRPVLGSVVDEPLLFDVMKRHSIDIVFHAAAYKHVRMVQENVAAGVINNVIGVEATARAAIKAKVGVFVLISTDKAVRPTSVMGSTKRVAEMILQGLASDPEIETIFLAVRFGNVLGSSGSVVPLFRQQIEQGGPIRITHPDVSRYFMLIPEAAQLVIQASAMAHGGEVFLLDMGEPVKIADLARTMVEIAGLTVRDESNPDGDIAFDFIGLRDGEKLHEELLIGENATPTEHERITRSHEWFLPRREIDAQIVTIKSLLRASEEEELKNYVVRLATTIPAGAGAALSTPAAAMVERVASPS